MEELKLEAADATLVPAIERPTLRTVAMAAVMMMRNVNLVTDSSGSDRCYFL
jgi:hypothetical protein